MDINSWSKKVKKRDDYTCQLCGTTDQIIAHHIKDARDYPELVVDIDNGQTLCRVCHIKLHNSSRPSVCFFERRIKYVDGQRTWKPIIPEKLKEQYAYYL